MKEHTVRLRILVMRAVQVLDIVRRVSPQIRAPIVVFLYFNPILYRTIDKMCQQLADAGAKGLCLFKASLDTRSTLHNQSLVMKA